MYIIQSIKSGGALTLEHVMWEFIKNESRILLTCFSLERVVQTGSFINCFGVSVSYEQ